MVIELGRTVACPVAGNPFSLDDTVAYRQWRAQKLKSYPTALAVVEVGQPYAMTVAEHESFLLHCRKVNMAIYRCPGADRGAVLALGRQLGLSTRDGNPGADSDGLSAITVATEGPQAGYIPYTDRPLQWHTDGYYNPPARQIRAWILHCVVPAAEGGENYLMDHELAYIFLRDTSPEWVEALMATDAMTIPAHRDEAGERRPAQVGPVFSVDPGSGRLQMRYTARQRNIVWRDDSRLREALKFLNGLLKEETSFVFRYRLKAGEGIVSNNVLHNRSGFRDDPAHGRRLLLRARYYGSIGSIAPAQAATGAPMLYLSEILLQHHELTSFYELIPLIQERARQGERFFRMDVRPPFPDTPENWEDRLEAAFT
jgi:alpha-ketoglutarate-dependent taurine dioxygenase